MRDGLEILAASAVVSLAALALIPVGPLGTEEAAGAGGTEQVSVMASSASVAAMVEQWERPPEVLDTPMEMDMPEPPAMPEVPQVAAVEPPAPTSSLPGVMPQVSPEAPTPPEPDTAPPERAQAPEISPRPPERPEPEPASVREDPPATQPQVQSAERAQQTARGSNGGANAGTAQQRQVATASPAQRQSAISQWGGQIQSRIARRAPRGAGRGTVVVIVTVARNGGLISAQVAQSSGNPAIDALAVRAVQSAGSFPAAPAALTDASYRFNVPIQSR